MRPNIDLTHNKFWELKGILESNYFTDIDELPEGIRSLAYHAVSHLPLYLAHEQTFKEHHVDQVIRNLGILLGHPAPQNRFQIMPPSSLFNLGNLIVKPYQIITECNNEAAPLAIARRGLLNLNRNVDVADAVSREEVVAYTRAMIDEKLKTLPACTQTEASVSAKVVTIPDEKKRMIDKHLKNARNFLCEEDANALTAEDIWHAMNNQLACVNATKISFYAYYQFLMKIAVIHGHEEHLSIFETDSDKTELIHLFLQSKNAEKYFFLLKEHGNSIPLCYANEFLRMLLSQEPVNEDALYLVIMTFPISSKLKLHFLESYLEKCSEIIPEKDLNAESALPIARVAIILLRSMNEQIKFSRSNKYLKDISNILAPRMKRLVENLELKKLIQLHSNNISPSEVLGDSIRTQFFQLVHEGCYQTVMQLIKFTNIFPEFLCLEDLRGLNSLTKGGMSIEIENKGSFNDLFNLFNFESSQRPGSFSIGSSYQLRYKIKVLYIPSVDRSLPSPILWPASFSSNASFQFTPVPVNLRDETTAPARPYIFSAAVAAVTTSSLSATSSSAAIPRPFTFSFPSSASAAAAAAAAASSSASPEELAVSMGGIDLEDRRSSGPKG